MKNSTEKLSAFHKGQILTEGLILVREDICDWFNKLFHEDVISGDGFLDSLHSGILLCDLIQRIYQHVARLPFQWPKKPPVPDRKATVGSFKARDNISLFLNWCRSIGLANTILFETKGLMQSDEEKNIVLTLLHLGEICVDLDIPVPEFARFNKEMQLSKAQMSHSASVYALGDTSDLGSTESGSISARSDSNIVDMLDSESSASINSPREAPCLLRVNGDANQNKKRRSSAAPRDNVDKSTSDKTFKILDTARRSPLETHHESISIGTQSRPSKFVKVNPRNIKSKTDKNLPEKIIRSKSRDDISKFQTTDSPTNPSCCSNIDSKIKEITGRCQCHTKFVIERTTLQEGMYKIGTKNIFVRMFRGNIMLRVGGGWETLNEYLNKVDPCCKSEQRLGLPRRQSVELNLCTDMTRDGLMSKNIRKFSQCELTTVKKKIGCMNYQETHVNN